MTLFADSIRFSETLTDKLVKDEFDDYDVETTISGSFSASLTVPGLGSLPFEEWAGAKLVITMGNFNFSGFLNSADTLSSTKAVFKETDETGVVSQLTVTRSGKSSVNTFTITGSAKRLSEWGGSIIAEDVAEFFEGAFQDEVEAEISFGDFIVDRIVYCTGKNTIRVKEVADPDFPEFPDEYELNNVQVSGQADFTSPSLAILSPKNGTRLTNGVVTVQVRATDDIGVENVQFSLNGDELESGESLGTNIWSKEFELVPGTNVVQITGWDISGNMRQTLLRVVFVVFSPLTLQIEGNGTVKGVVNGQLLEVGRDYTLTAKPGTGFLFSNWVSSVVVTSPTFKFMMESNQFVQANFVINPFVPLKGSYNGLFTETGVASHESSGFFSAQITDRGKFTAKLIQGGRRLKASGQFDLEGNAAATVKRAHIESPLDMQLRLDLSGGSDQIVGVISDGIWSAELVSDRAVFNAQTNPALIAGKYTLHIPGNEDPALSPEGDSFGTATVASNGIVKFAGDLADGTRFSQSVPVSKDGRLPLYASLYGNRGSVWSWLQFDHAQVGSDVAGDLSWIKLAMPTARQYPAGFSNTVESVGSLYTPPMGATNSALVFSNAMVAFTGGNLSFAFTNDVLLASNKVYNLSSNKLVLTLVKPSGLFNGNVVVPGTTRSLPFKGAVFQKQDFGSGYLPGTNRSARVYFGP